MMRLILILILLTALTPIAFANPLVEAAQKRTEGTVRYDGRYMRLDYPNGDVPASIGVCTDVVIRSYRAAYGFDLQKAVHEDMRENFNAYPSQRIWGLSRPDKNIDHRRVPNLEVWLSRHGESLPLGSEPENFRPGDIVSYCLTGNLPHIGIVSARLSSDGIPLLIHNIGAGPREENVLFAYTMTGHYRFAPQP